MSDEYTIGRIKGEFALVFYDDRGKRHRRRLGTADPSTAKRLAPALYSELTRPPSTTVEHIWKAYERHMEGRNILDRLGYSWKALGLRFGPMPAEQVTDEDCKAHIIERRAKGIRDGTLHTELGHLRMVLVWAHKKRLITYAPHIARPPKTLPKRGHLTKREALRLMEACETPHLKLFVNLALATGARSAAILDLKWDRCDFIREQIDLRNPEITVPHKGRAIVPMTRTVKAELVEARRGALSNYVVEWAGKQVGSVKKGLAAAGKRAGLAKVTPHMLRHSAAVHMAEAGVDMEEIAQYLGHDDVYTTRKVYARYSPSHLKKAAEALEYDDLDTD